MMRNLLTNKNNNICGKSSSVLIEPIRTIYGWWAIRQAHTKYNSSGDVVLRENVLRTPWTTKSGRMSFGNTTN